MIPLRPYQQDCVDSARDMTREGKRRILLVAPTGSGKTVIASHIIASALDRGRRVLMFAHRRELIRQPFVKLVRFGVPPDQIGIEMAGVRYPKGGQLFGDRPATADQIWQQYAARRPQAPVQIASIDTLRNRAKPPADLIVIDEAHRALARSYQDLLRQYDNPVVLGLTATPMRADGRGLGDMFEDLLLVSSYRQLVTEGYLLEPRVWTVPEASRPDLSGVRVRSTGDYDESQLAAACDREGLVGDLVDHYQRHGNGSPAFAFAVSVAHSQHIAEKFLAAGIPAAHLDGTTPAPQRDETLARLAMGDIRVVSNCDVCTEGTDVPEVGTIIMARPTKSLRVYLQQCGRGSRPYGDQPFVILDHAGCVLEHGLPQDDRDWSLEGRKRQQKGRSAPCLTCPSCLAALPLGTRVCPECGHVFVEVEESSAEVEERDGQLVEVELLPPGERWAAVVAEWRKKNASRDVPLKPGWCFFEYRRRFNQRPPAGVKRPRLTDDEERQRARFDALKQTADEKGYAQGWAYAQLKRSA